MAFSELPTPDEFDKLSQKELEILDLKKNITQKILELTNVLELSEQDYYEREGVRKQILYLLRNFYPKCELFIFGSSINGYGCKGCDLDLLFLPYPKYCNFNFKDVEDESVPNPNAVFKSQNLKDKLLLMNETFHLKFVKKVMVRKPEIFKQIIFIPAKCPILKIKFSKINFECDLSASNKLVLRNSELLGLYGRLDSRIRPLIILLRYWAKSLGFIKKNLLSSYAFCFMVIFALQNTDPPVLPSVNFLNVLAGFSSKIDGWETAFCVDVGRIPPTLNTATLEELLLHFFTFYWNFDFVQYVVSPSMGKPWAIKDIKHSKDERLKSFSVTSFSIQDPFLLSTNISRDASMKTSFKSALLIGADLVQQGNFNLSTFFKAEYYQKCLSLSHEAPCYLKYISDKCEIFAISITYNSISKLGLTTSYLPWYEKGMQAIFDVLQYGLLMECEIIDQVFWGKKPPKKKKKKTVSTISLKQLECVMSIQCTVYYNTWNSRSKAAEAIDLSKETDLDKSMCGTLKKEHCISKHLVIEPTVIKEPPLMFFQCNCYKYPMGQLSDLVLVLKPLTNSMDTLGLGKFLRKFIPRTVEKVMKEA